MLWLYYRDLELMQAFYEGMLGVPLLVDQGWAKVYPVAGSGFIGLVDGERGLHQATEQKGVTVSFFNGSNSILPQSNNQGPLSVLLDSNADSIGWRMGFTDSVASTVTIDFFSFNGALVNSIVQNLAAGSLSSGLKTE